MPQKVKASKVFSADERDAMTNRAKEMKAAATKEEEAAANAEAIAALPPADKALAQRFHAIVKSAAPALAAKTWYGMPAYARDGKIVCHFQPAGKFKTRYATIGFSDNAKLDDGNVWPVAYALTKLTPADEARITALVRKAAS